MTVEHHADPANQLYDEDFFAWTQLQARQLQRLARTYPNPALDLPHLAEEVRAEDVRALLEDLERAFPAP